jgi:azurin
MTEGVTMKDMSESEPEEDPHELPTPKSSFVIPKVPRRKQKCRKKKTKAMNKTNNVFITNPIAYNNSDTSDGDSETKTQNVKADKKTKKVKKHDSDEDDYGDDDDFEDNPKEEETKNEKESETDNNKSHTDLPIPKPHIIMKKHGSISKLKDTSNFHNKSKYNTNTKVKQRENKFEANGANSTSKKTGKGSMFNSRVPTGGFSSSGKNSRIRNSSQIRKYNMNKSSTAGRKTRPDTQGNKSEAIRSENLASISNIHQNDHSKSRKRIMTSYKDKRSASRSRLGTNKKSNKEHEILITKTYDISLVVGKKSNHKKISYVNKDDSACVFTVKSSHPDQLTFKNNDIQVQAGEKAKFGIKFKQVDEPKLTQYVLFLTKDGEPHENILLNVKYEHKYSE